MTKRVTIEFDDDRAADFLIDAMKLGRPFDFNPVGRHNDQDEWVDGYRIHEVLVAKPGTSTIWEKQRDV